MQKRLLKYQKLKFIPWLFLIFIGGYLQAQVLDQSQLVYNGGLSARTLNGYSIFQSFTAGISGTLSKINIGFFNEINGAGTLKIYTGVDTQGILIQSNPVNVYCQSGSCLLSFPVSAPVLAGQLYTFQFIPGPGIPDPYGVQIADSGTYQRGNLGSIDPSGIDQTDFSMVFQTFVTLNSTSSGNVGINVPSPQRSLHVSDVIRLEPRNTAPTNPQKGDIYFDNTINKLRVFDGTIWQNCW